MYASVVNALPRVRVCVRVCATVLFARLLYSEHYPLHVKTILDLRLRDKTFPALIPEMDPFSFSKYKRREHRRLTNCHSSVNFKFN